MPSALDIRRLVFGRLAHPSDAAPYLCVCCSAAVTEFVDMLHKHVSK